MALATILRPLLNNVGRRSVRRIVNCLNRGDIYAVSDGGLTVFCEFLGDLH